MDDLRSLLRQAAEVHQPDRSRISEGLRQRRARAAGSGRGRSRAWGRASSYRAVLAALATVGVVGAGGFAVVSVVHEPAPRHAAGPVTPGSGTAAASAPRSGATAGSARPPVGSATGQGATRSPSSAPGSPAVPSGTAASAPPAARTEDGPLRARGTVNAHSTVYWAQNDLTVDVRQPLASLSVEVRVALTASVRETGQWQTLPTADFTVGVTRTDGFLVFRWVLRPGQTVPAGQHVFAGQYNHATGDRDAGQDTFRVETTVSGRTASVWGSYPAGNPG